MNDNFCPLVTTAFCTVGGLSSGLLEPPHAVRPIVRRPATAQVADRIHNGAPAESIVTVYNPN